MFCCPFKSTHRPKEPPQTPSQPRGPTNSAPALRKLTQVGVIRFAELLLPAEAQLELRFVGAPQGVAVLQGGEGVTRVAVGDEAKVVPGQE